MTQEEIIRSPLGREQLVALARDCGAIERYFGNGLHGIAFHKKEWLERFAYLVAAHEREKLKNVAIFSKWYEELDKAVLAEREACAKVCEENRWGNLGAGCAAAIRARGE